MKWYWFLPPLYFIAVSLSIFVFSPEKVEKHPVYSVGHGRASKMVFEGHSYVIWQQNMSDCIIHDPDCTCQKQITKES